MRTTMPRIDDTSRASLARALGLGSLILGSAAVVLGQAGKPVFPQPFLVEHQVTQTDADGGVFQTPAVTDYYGGSWIVSVRPDKSWLLVDLGRREITEVQPEKATYTVLGFDRLAELRRRLQAAERPRVATEPSDAATPRDASRDREPARIEVERVAVPVRRLQSAGPAANAPRVGQELQTFRARAVAESSDGSSRPSAEAVSVEVDVDPRIRLTPEARRALAGFEKDVLGTSEPRVTHADLVAAVRDKAEGAFPVRVERPLAGVGAAGKSEDTAKKLEPIAAFPVEYLKIPDGCRRVAHPLEVMVAHAESEAELNQAMSRSASQK